jgi:MoaA/NifB/PqqE/SkfB family radical SAM enzyme
VTVSSANADHVLAEGFRKRLDDLSAAVRIFVEYTPMDESSRRLVLTDGQRASLWGYARTRNRKSSCLHLVFPGDESAFGGCLAAGRGFVHVNPAGRLEPCPFAPFSDSDLSKVSLREALGSRFLRDIRGAGERLTESGSGCALWADREWVRTLLEKQE